MVISTLTSLILIFSLAEKGIAVAPTVQLDNGVFTGTLSGSTHRFLGIPFAKPPVGDLRYRLPQTIPPYAGTYDATNYGPNCIQPAANIPNVTVIAGNDAQNIVNALFGALSQPESEDCLTLNVIRPSTATPSSNLPVLLWIYGGAFQSGSTSVTDGGSVVERSIALGTPVIYISINYRLNGFGFLGGSEVKAAGVGNLGFHDQREAMRWVQTYITQFGGDPTKVTLWGQSAGAISISLQMLVNGGNPSGLFRGAFIQSGGPIPLNDVAASQGSYDALIAATGCSNASDTLACLRTIPLATLKTAINSAGPSSTVVNTFGPGIDGTLITDNPQILVQQGAIANIPFVTGNCDDEGTIFALPVASTVITDANFKAYVKSSYPFLTDAQVDQIATFYTSDITQGSPFNTGILNAITPEYKRLAALSGDAILQAPRRWMLQNTASTNHNIWVYLSKRFKLLPVVGSMHSSDLLNSYGGGEMQNQVIRFANTLNPNGQGLLDFQWPRYDLQSRQMLTYLDGIVPLTISHDTYRQDAMNFLTSLTA
ncbi:Lipase 4 [Psilocybe cubensis]|uniref:Lipase 4 n=2 Tax=Psilocybe cubensis TaxID=181762 RepID=A0ACB8HBI4_PSICU|nr:Lipase 4 [Psilocybe cubensis]KAH9484564.1 Lipase 4 [Psilocybe cubensis]